MISYSSFMPWNPGSQVAKCFRTVNECELCEKGCTVHRNTQWNKIIAIKIFTNSFNENLLVNAICMRWAEKRWSWNEEQKKAERVSEWVNEWRVIVMIIQIDEPYCGQREILTAVYLLSCAQINYSIDQHWIACNTVEHLMLVWCKI